MKLFLVIALISLLTSGVYSQETITVTQELKAGTTEDDKCAVLVFKCAGNGTPAAADAGKISHTYTYTKDNSTYQDIDGDFYATTPAAVASTAYTSYLFVKPGKFAKNDTVNIKCASTWTATTSNNGVATAMGQAITIKEAAATCDTPAVFTSENSDSSTIKFTTTSPTSTDAINYLGKTATTPVAGSTALTLSTLTANDIFYVKYAPAASTTNQALFVYTYNAAQKFTVTASGNTDDCKLITPVFKFPKNANYDNAKSTLTVNVTTAANGASPAQANQFFQTKSADTTDVTASVFIQSGTFGNANSNGVITLTLTQIKSDDTVLQTNQIVYNLSATTQAAPCAFNPTLSISYSADCTAQNIDSDVQVTFAALDGTSLGANLTDVQQVQAVAALLTGQVTVKVSNAAAEEKFFSLNGSTQPGCVVTAKTAGTKACEVSTFTCERKNPSTSQAVTYTWTLYDTVKSANVPAATFDPNAAANAAQAGNISTLTIPKDTLTGANAYKVKCLSNLAGTSESNEKETDYTPTSCVVDPQPDDDDNSQILSALVLVLLALLL